MRKLTALAAALLAALAAGALVVTGSFGSSHREAPLTSQDPTGDDTDLYAFTAKENPDALTVVANWIPFEDPAGGPNFYALDDKARYYINVDNTGDGVADVRYRFDFRTQVRNGDTFLSAFPGASSLGDPRINVRQLYNLTRIRYKDGQPSAVKVLAHDVRVAPNNIGPKTFPDYEKVANEAIRPLGKSGKVFVGPRDDPFFVDLGTAFDAINFRNGTGASGGGKDDLAGYGVHAVVLQIPKSQVTKDLQKVAGPGAGNAVVGLWASTERRRTTVRNDDGSQSGSGWVQVSRLGNPLINEVVIGLKDKDRFNATQPKDDAANFGDYAVNSRLAATINALFHLGIKETNRTDIVNALLVGIPGLTKIAPDAVPADTLKINLGTAPVAQENRFGVIGGDTAGFPNGRRLSDDVVDIELRVIGGYLLPPAQGGKKLPLGDGVDRNDKAFLSTFPYLPPTRSGFDSELKRDEPAHEQTPADNPS